MSLFEIRETELSVAEVIAAVTRPEAGGIAVFVGTVRNENAGLSVTRLEYQAYASMAAKEMARIGAEIAQELGDVRVAVLHRVGSLVVGEAAVVCAASAPHRGEAFQACRLLIDRIKARVPIWKREHGPSGPYWVGWEDARCDPSAEHAHAHRHHHDQ
ncbi:MAG TPA: molybdenum cofactor biosynthesis protein MoaE [Polyangiaceae bacterium]|nr:molybdenum cofactor biosynthesis protein MoaE [Polyangiaceae bacterium]